MPQTPLSPGSRPQTSGCPQTPLGMRKTKLQGTLRWNFSRVYNAGTVSPNSKTAVPATRASPGSLGVKNCQGRSGEAPSLAPVSSPGNEATGCLESCCQHQNAHCMFGLGVGEPWGAVSLVPLTTAALPLVPRSAPAASGSPAVAPQTRCHPRCPGTAALAMSAAGPR